MWVRIGTRRRCATRIYAQLAYKVRYTFSNMVIPEKSLEDEKGTIIYLYNLKYSEEEIAAQLSGGGLETTLV
jgi:hypothetical protein